MMELDLSLTMGPVPIIGVHEEYRMSVDLKEEQW